MARIAPAVHSYDPDDYPIPPALRDEIHAIVRRGARKFRDFAFANDDFVDMAVGLSIAANVFRDRKYSADKQDVMSELAAIERLAGELLAILDCAGPADISNKGRRAKREAVDRLRDYALEQALPMERRQAKAKARHDLRSRELVNQGKHGYRDFHTVDFMSAAGQLVVGSIQNLVSLRIYAAATLSETKGLETLKSGRGDSAHLTALLKELDRVFARRELPRGIQANAKIVQVATVLCSLLPAEMRGEPGAIKERHRLMREATRA